MVVRVPLEKQGEFFQCAYHLLGEEPPTLRGRRMLRDLYDRDVFCWMADARSEADITSYVDTPGFHAFRAAAHVLGGMVDFRVLSDQDVASHLATGTRGA
jgi:hypothetical protein